MLNANGQYNARAVTLQYVSSKWIGFNSSLINLIGNILMVSLINLDVIQYRPI